MKRSPIRPVSKRRAALNRAKGPVREQVFARDGFRCRLAGVDGAGPCFGGITPHHVVKASQGGAYTADNLVTLCSFHNDEIEASASLAQLAERLGLVHRRSS